MTPWRRAALALTDFVFPERCAVCAAVRGERPWCRTGDRVRGLRPWDRPHLCAGCLAAVGRGTVRGDLGERGGELAIRAGAPTGGDLVRIVGCWKYEGCRGVAWPAAALVGPVLDEWAGRLPAPPCLVPIPLHRGRARQRGFNQAELLARLLARRTGLDCRPQLLRRLRDTGHQARLQGTALRQGNVAGAFAAAPAPAGPAPLLLLVDDLVTTGHTVLAAAAALRRRGWIVAGALALGLARPGEGPVDRPGTRF